MITIMRKIFTAIVLAILVFGFGQTVFAQICEPAPAGLISWWSGDGNALDSRSRNNSNQTLGAPLFVTAHVGQGMKFDGIDDGFTVPDSANLDVGVGDSFSVGLWVRADSLSGNASQFQSVFSKEDIAGGGGGTYRLLLQQNGIFDFEITDTSSNNRQAFVSGIATGSFNHVTAVFNRSAGNMRIYLNGVPQPTVDITGVGSLANAGRFFIGHRSLDSGTGAFSFDGAVDELSYYNRALSTPEIQAIFNAGTAGKCKPTATVAPSGLVGWWAGDGNTNDISGNANNGTLNGGATFTVEKVGQGINFNGANQFVEMPDSSSNSIPGEITVEVWIKPASVSGTQTILSKYDSSASPQLSYFFGLQGGEVELAVYGSADGSLRRILDTTTANISTTSFTHVAATFNPTGQVMKIYVNGVEALTTLEPSSTNVSSIFDSTTPVRIGAVFNTAGGLLPFNGLIDEPSVYNRALTQAEVTSIFNAGIAGKLKTASTPTGFAFEERVKGRRGDGEIAPETVAVSPGSPEVVNATVGDVTVTFPTVSTAGTTQQIPLDINLFPALALGHHTGLAYDIATSAVFSGNPSICFNLPYIQSAAFGGLRVMHFEGGAWVNVTNMGASAFPTLCTNGVTSFSPFSIAFVGPTAAGVSVSGRAATPNGSGIRGVLVSLTDVSGNARLATTSSFGYFTFDGVTAGETYVFQVSSRRYQFANNPRIVVIKDTLTGLDFTALPFNFVKNRPTSLP